MREVKKTVFICGCARSGTTLLGSMLGAGEGCISTPESQLITETASKIAKKKIANTHNEILSSFTNSFRLKLWGINERNITKNDQSNINALADLTLQCVDLYASKLGQRSWNTWIDHTPEHIKHIKLLSELFPNSRFIHIVRDGRGTFASARSLSWGPAGAKQGAIWWTRRIALGLAAEHAFAERIIRVHFEDLVYDPESELKRICAFAGLEFGHEMLEGKGFAVPEYTRQQHDLVGKPPDRSVIDKWKTVLSSREVEIFEYMSGSLLEYLDYVLIYGIKAQPPNRWERLYESLLPRTYKNILDIRRRMKRKTYI